MEARYKKDMNHNYLILEYEESTYYEANMVLHNQIKGLLECHKQIFNGKTEMYYDISSKQPLSRIYTKRELKSEDVRLLLSSILRLLDELKRYLLSAENIVFDAEYCYCNLETKQPEWVFYPKCDAGNNMRNLAEFLIDRVDHGERVAVDMAYRFYKLVKDEILTRKELEKILEEYEEDKEEISAGNINNYVQNQDIFAESYQEEVKDESKQSENVTRWSLIKNFFRNKISESAQKSRIENVTYTRNASITEWETFGLEQENSYSGETVVMGIQSMTAARRLRSLSKGSDSYISLKKLPCVLGKMEDCADVVLKDPSISRMHARIYEEAGELYLQDLNSTNGSYINNLELESNETVKLKIGDEIMFGNLRYIYE